MLIGESAAVYEAFTGRSLPRQGLRRQWRYLTLVAAGYSLAGGIGYAAQFNLAYLTGVILTMTVFLAFAFALVSWRTYLDRERYIAHLRPFVSSEHIYEALLSPDKEIAPNRGARRRSPRSGATYWAPNPRASFRPVPSRRSSPRPSPIWGKRRWGTSLPSCCNAPHRRMFELPSRNAGLRRRGVGRSTVERPRPPRGVASGREE